MVLIYLNTAHPAKMNDSVQKPIEVRFTINSIATGHNNGLNILDRQLLPLEITRKH